MSLGEGLRGVRSHFVPEEGEAEEAEEADEDEGGEGEAEGAEEEESSPALAGWGGAPRRWTGSRRGARMGGDEGLPVCRICLGPGAGGDLVAPCACRGTQLLVHRRCLNDWRRLSAAPRSYTHCPQCLAAYRIRSRELPPLARALGHPTVLLVGAVAVSLAACWALGAVLRALESMASRLVGPASPLAGFTRPHSLAFLSVRWRPFRPRPFFSRPRWPLSFLAARAWQRQLEDLAVGGIWLGLLKATLIGLERQQRLGGWPPYWLLPLATCFAGSGLRTLRLLAAGGYLVATAEAYEWAYHAFKAWEMRNGEEILDIREGHGDVAGGEGEGAGAGAPSSAAPLTGGEPGWDAPALWVRQGLFILRQFIGREEHLHQD